MEREPTDQVLEHEKTDTQLYKETDERPRYQPVESTPDPIVEPLGPVPEIAVSQPLRAEKTERREKAAPQSQENRRKTAVQDGKAAHDRRAPEAPAATASNGMGRGRSDSDTNYRGLVAAHLARHQQFPADARGRGDQGTPAVTFSIDGAGRVTSMRLARSSGVTSLDQEVQAMARRASPFPAPPLGHPMTFTVPISFQLR
jgi:protein TonB